MTKTFSVVTLTCNSELYLDETIQSVIYQRGEFYIDYVIVDNCSSDSTLTILGEYQEVFDHDRVKFNCLGVRFRFISEQDEGMYDALCKGMALCDGDYFSYINSDDFYLPNAFSTVKKIFENKEIRWLTGIPCLYNEYGAIVTANTPCVFKSSYIRSGVYGRYLPHIQQESTFWRRELNDGLDFSELSNFRYAGDFYIWHYFSKRNELFTVKAQLSGFRAHSANKSLDVDAYNNEFNLIEVEKLRLVDYPRILIYKILFKLLGNKFLSFFHRVIHVH